MNMLSSPHSGYSPGTSHANNDVFSLNINLNTHLVAYISHIVSCSCRLYARNSTKQLLMCDRRERMLRLSVSLEATSVTTLLQI